MISREREIPRHRAYLSKIPLVLKVRGIIVPSSVGGDFTSAVSLSLSLSLSSCTVNFFLKRGPGGIVGPYDKLTMTGGDGCLPGG